MNAQTLNLKFRVAGVPVTVQPWFWLGALILGSNYRGPMVLFWMAVVFVSVLVHEMGHAAASRYFGVPASVVMHGMGGYTQPAWALPRWKRVAMTLAGPMAGFLLAALAWTVSLLTGALGGMAAWTVNQMVAVNVAWGVLNLLPVPPLDGGQVMLLVAGPRRRRVAMQAGTVLGVLLALAALSQGQVYLALLLGFLTYQNIKTLRTATA